MDKLGVTLPCGCGSKPCTPGERQNRWQMDVHPQNGAVGYATHGHVFNDHEDSAWHPNHQDERRDISDRAVLIQVWFLFSAAGNAIHFCDTTKRSSQRQTPPYEEGIPYHSGKCFEPRPKPEVQAQDWVSPKSTFWSPDFEPT